MVRPILLSALFVSWSVILAPLQSWAGPTDIVIVLDTSGDMTEEIADFQANLNTLAAILEAEGVDAHFVLIGAGACIPPPLGSGSCPDDESLPQFRHIQISVGSNAPLVELLDTYPQWQGSLRPGAARVIMVVSSDDSSLSAAAFEAQLLAVDPSFEGYQFDAYVAQSTCPAGAAVGSTYLELVASTGGVDGDLCDQSIVPFLDECAAATVELSGMFRRGDANRDGGFDIADPILVLGFLFSSNTLDCPLAGDSNDDEALDIADAIYSLTALFGGGPSPLPPFLDCGTDPTPGPLECGGATGCL